MCSVRNAVPFLVCNLDAFVLTVGLCFAEHCYVACCYQVVQNNSNDGINSCKACNSSNLHTL